MQLSDNWIRWDSPSFLSGHQWPEFMLLQRSRYPDLRDDLQATLRALDGIWILKQSSGYEYQREHEVRLGST
jgi:hypothetical protein